MSAENIRLYSKALDCWNRGDVDAFVELASAEVEIFTALAGVEGSYRGIDGMRHWHADFHDVFPDWHAEPLSLWSVGDATIAHLRATGHGGISGTPVEESMWNVVHWREGKAIRISRHESEAEALEAVGLRE